MSSNFFAALDDSGDEAPASAKGNIKKSEPKTTKKADTSAATSKTVAAASKGNDRRRPNNNDRNTKSGRGERTSPRDGKRAYDRRSGTGRGKEIKKGGGGARNWGSDKAEAKKMEGTINEDEVKEDKPAEEKVDAVAEEAPVEEKPEDKTMTYAEYMASKGKKEETVREVENEFKGLSAAAKVEEDFLVMGGAKQKKTKKKKDGDKKTVDVGFRVAKPNAGGDDRDRGGRGGRGRGDRDRGGRGGRGSRDGRGKGRGRGGGRGSKNANNTGSINVQDEAAFPSL